MNETLYQILQKMNKSPWSDKWRVFCEFINRRPNGAIISRKAIMEYMRPGSDTTIDDYRNCLTKAGFLVVVKRGIYEKVNSIPIGISKQDIQKLGKDKDEYRKNSL